MNINEIKSWAKSRGFTVKKSGEGYVWFGEGAEASDPASIEDVALSIFNRITDNRFVDYQKAYREGSSK
jgi:hypothetical protein